MIIDPQTVLGRLARYSWLMLAMAALGLLVPAPGLAWALGEDAAGCWTSNTNPPVDQAFRESEEHFTTGDVGLLLVPCQFAPTFGSDGMDSQASSAAQTSSTNSGDQCSAEDEKQRLNVNPVTGLAVAAESNYSPLTGNERWKLYFKMNYLSVGSYFAPVVTAMLLDQATGSPRQWGRGFPGFGRRVASRVGSAILQGTFQAPMAFVLHEDVRYISSSRHGFMRRAAHAVLYSFLTYNSQGHTTLNIANLSAYYASTAVSTAWLPGIQNAARYTFSNATEQIGLSVPVNVLQEFWPEIRHYVLHRH
jgi:hypothetical protein